MHDGHDHHAGAVPHEPSEQEALALLDYMLHHNEHHAGELSALADRLGALGKAEAAKQLRLAGEDFAKGNLRLQATLAALKE